MSSSIARLSQFRSKLASCGVIVALMLGLHSSALWADPEGESCDMEDPAGSDPECRATMPAGGSDPPSGLEWLETRIGRTIEFRVCLIPGPPDPFSGLSPVGRATFADLSIYNDSTSSFYSLRLSVVGVEAPPALGEEAQLWVDWYPGTLSPGSHIVGPVRPIQHCSTFEDPLWGVQPLTLQVNPGSVILRDAGGSFPSISLGTDWSMGTTLVPQYSPTNLRARLFHHENFSGRLVTAWRVVGGGS